MSSSEAPNAPASGSGAEESNKRAALAGQWRTPPLPIFPTSNNGQPEATGTENIQDLHVSQLPDSTEDYAKALQEAYRRGAEAAAAMVQQQPAFPSAVSCPDLKQQSIIPAPVEQLEQPEQQQVPILPPPPPQQPTVVPTPLTPSAAAMPPPAPVSKSMSLPDMSTYAAQQEEEKRKKRLARNRASARLRRLRKKNLVCIYLLVSKCTLYFSHPILFSLLIYRWMRTRRRLVFWKRP